jgi:hypothetical protein
VAQKTTIFKLITNNNKYKTMKKLITNASHFLYALLAIVLASCGDRNFPVVQTTFTVTEIELNKKQTAIYKIVPIEHKDLNVNTSWICDTINAFKVGDTVAISHYR